MNVCSFHILFNLNRNISVAIDNIGKYVRKKLLYRRSRVLCVKKVDISQTIPFFSSTVSFAKLAQIRSENFLMIVICTINTIKFKL